MAEVVAIAAIGKNRVLGKGNDLIWRIPDDLKRFKALTIGHPLILGRKTFESIIQHTGGKPLPGRTSIVVTRDVARTRLATEGVIVVGSVEEAIAKAKELDAVRIAIGGGAQIYAAALPYTDRLALTVIDSEADGDAYFPEYENEFTAVISDEAHEWNGISYRWIDLARG